MPRTSTGGLQIIPTGLGEDGWVSQGLSVTRWAVLKTFMVALFIISQEPKFSRQAKVWLGGWRRSMSTSVNNFLRENFDSDDDDDDDSETNDNSDDYYQPISAVDGADSEEEDSYSNGDSTPPRANTNNFHGQDLCNGVRGIDLKEENNTEEEDSTGVAASELEIWRAFREDDSRRNAPLPRENANRIMDAMRGISLRGFTPDWANQVPETQWIDQLARLRRQPPPPPPPSSAAGAPSVTQN